MRANQSALWPILSAFVLSLPDRAQADPQLISVAELQWSAPEGCPDQASFEQRVAEYIGRDVPQTNSLSAARVEVVKRGSSFRVTLHIEQHHLVRTRVLQTMGCSEGLDAAALIVALAIDPTISVHLPAAPQTAPASPPGRVQLPVVECECSTSAPILTPAKPCTPAAVTASPQTNKEQASRRSRSGPWLSAHLASELSYRQLPGIPFSVGVAAALNWPHLWLSLGVQTNRGVERQQTKSADFRLVQGRVSACWLSGERLSVGPCAAMGFGALHGTGAGVKVPEGSTELWVSNSFGLLLRYWHGGSAVAGLYANADWPWRRPSFEFSEVPFYRPPAVGWIGGMFVGLKFD
jgi:hypothetical protein